MAPFSGLLAYLWPRNAPGVRRAVILSLACLILAKVCATAVPLAYKGVIDRLGVEAAHALPVGLILAYGAARFLAAAFEDLRDTIFVRVSQGATRHLGLRVFRTLLYLDLRFHLDRRTGGLARSVDRGTQAVTTLLTRVLFSVVPTVFEIVLVLGILWHLTSVWFGLVTLVSVVAYAAFTVRMVSWRTRFRRELNELTVEAGAKSIYGLLNFETIKLFGNEEHEAARLDRSLKRQEEAAVRNQLTFTALSFGQSLIVCTGLVGVTLMAADGIRAGTMTVGDLVLVNAYLIQLYLPLNTFAAMYREIRQALVDAEAMAILLRTKPAVTDSLGARALKVTGGEVQCDAVSFGSDERRTVLRDVSFTIPAGQTFAVVGATGSGKSTLSRLLFRFYDVGAGTIRIDGQDIREVTQASLRSSMGVVPQDTVLFNDTIRYNIAYGRPGAADDEIASAARSAHIHDFIESLPDGYDSRVGERGLKLSGGEKQRVAIARTVLKHARILVFDEATSALDTATEREIMADLREISRDVTTLIIAHRLSTIVDAHQILVLDQGRIVERGRHRDLMAAGGRYAQMWHRQGARFGAPEEVERPEKVR